MTDLFEDADAARPSIATELIHHAYRAPAGFEAPQPGVHKASTVFFANVAAMRARNWREKVGYTYGLHGTPTTFTLEERIATLEGGLHCVLVPSGLAAIALTDAALLRAGDEVLIPDNAYNPNKELARHELARWGIAHRLYDPMDAAALAALLTPATKLVWIEPPGSVTMEFPDVAALVRAARSQGALVALDNTWGAGLAFDPFRLERDAQGASTLGADLSVHALTKYPSGGGDVLMGSVTTRDPALHLKLNATHMRMGW
ncbi:MAG TPA: PLP-dependent transferase, partial [Burkholderiaceae bacterium]|nr:PLP-dependent transferase [Burkholderiaceae bacterium]